MLPRVEYLGWAIETFPHAVWDLATSGLPSIAASELGAPPDLGDPAALRMFAAAIAERYSVPVTEVMPALGTSGAVWIVAAAVLGREPAEVLIEQPTYEPLLRVVEGLGARVRRLPRDRGESYRIDPDRVARALTDDTRLVVLASPHNPTGVVTPDEDIAKIAQACASCGAYLLVDEVYRELAAPRTTARKLGPNVLVTSSLTKCFGVGWARAGWALMPESLRAAAHTAEMHVTGVLPSMCGAVGAHAMARIDALAARADRLTEGKRAIVDAFIAKHPRLSWTPPPPRALFGLVYADGIDVAAGLRRAAQEHGVVAVPGSFFDEPSSFRLSWASLPPHRLAEALDLLARSLELAA